MQKEIIKKYALMLLNLYGVEREEIVRSPEALDTFVETLAEEKKFHAPECTNAVCICGKGFFPSVDNSTK